MKTKMLSSAGLVALAVWFLFSSTMPTFAQQESSTEILVYVKQGTIEVPTSFEGTISLGSTTIKNALFLALLQRFGINDVKRAHPNFNLADTLRYAPDGSPIRMLNLANLYKIVVPPPNDRDTIIAALSRLPEVIYAERNGGWRLYANDTHYGKQWYLNNTGQSGGTVGADIKIEAAWQIFPGSSSVKIGLIDSGVKTDHEDLTGKASGDLPDYGWTGNYHGTHVAGIAAAKTDNGLGIAGVDKNAQIYSRRIFDTQNHQGDNGYIHDAIVDVVNQGCNVVNNSWGANNYSVTIRAAFAYAYKMNRLSVVAMDDHGATGATYPAAFPQVLAVGATDDNDARVTRPLKLYRPEFGKFPGVSQVG